MRTRILAIFLAVFSTAAAAQSGCPAVVPQDALKLFLPLALAPGPYPYSRDGARLWAWCEGAPTLGTPITVRLTDPANDVLSAVTSDSAYPPLSTAGLLPNIHVGALVTAVRPAGTLQTSLEVTAGNNKVTLPVQVTFTSAPLLQVAEGPLVFSNTGQPTATGQPMEQTLDVWFRNTATTRPFTVAVENAPWLSVTPTVGAGFTQLTATANLSNQNIGSSIGTIVITAPDAINSPVRIPVRLLVAPVQFSSNPQTLEFRHNLGGTPPAAKQLTVNSQPQFRFAFSATTDVPWLSVTPGSASTPDAKLTVSANGTGLAEGTYTGNVVLSGTNAATARIPVTLTVAAVSLNVTPTSYSFIAWPGIWPLDTSLLITSSAGASIPWQVTKTSGEAWLAMTFPSSGTTPRMYNFIINLPPIAGTYAGSLAVSSTQANNSPVAVPITLTVLPSAAVTFSGSLRLTFRSQGGTSAPAQMVNVTAGSATSFTATATSSGNWLVVTPSSGTPPATLNVSVRTTGLDYGSRTGKITLTLTLVGGATGDVNLPVDFHYLQ